MCCYLINVACWLTTKRNTPLYFCIYNNWSTLPKIKFWAWS